MSGVKRKNVNQHSCYRSKVTGLYTFISIRSCWARSIFSWWLLAV